jgi:hypothetical protein
MRYANLFEILHHLQFLEIFVNIQAFHLLCVLAWDANLFGVLHYS